MDATVRRIIIDRRDVETLGAFAEDEPADSRPPVDVIETAGAIEVVVDVPGVTAASIHITCTDGTLVVSGHKRAPVCEHRQAAFHLAERTFGPFACVVRCEVAVDAGRARATLHAGELRVVLPRINERRGREIPITIDAHVSSPGP
jgi:HSP20 family molecular chaperone IbpA